MRKIRIFIRLALIGILLQVSVSNLPAQFPGFPTRLVFSIQPSHTTAGEVISPAIIVEARNQNNNLDIRFNGQVNLSIRNNAGGGTLSGTTSVTAAEGVAHFTNISIDKAGAGYTLQAQSFLVPTVESNSFTISAAPPVQLVKISGDGQSGSVNSPLPQMFVIEVRDNFNNPVPNIPVNFSIVAQPSSSGASISPISAVTGANGRASTRLTMGNKSGSYSVQAETIPLAPQIFTATLASHSISGTVSKDGVPLAGVTVQSTGGHSQSVTTNSNGSYVFDDVLNGASGINITPALTGHVFTPANRTISNQVTGNITGQNFSAAILTFTVSGRITRNNSSLQGVTVTASGGHSQTVTTNSNGVYSLTNIPYGTTGITIMPALTGHSFSPANRTVSGPVTANITGEGFSASLLTFTITGTVTKDGSPLPNASITASGGHSQTVTTNSNGVYALTNVTYGSSNITITPTMTGHSFSPANRTISNQVTGDISGQHFSAAILTYTITGRITRNNTSLQGVTVTASGGHNQTVTTGSNGVYSLTNVPYGTTGITITPELTGHSFAPANRNVSGPVTDNITGEGFSASLLTFTITGTITRDGSPVAGATVAATGGHSQTVTTNSNGIYTLSGVVYGSTNITITPTMAGHTFSPANRTVGGPVTANTTGLNFTAALLTYTISGRITRNNSPLQDVTVTASGGHNQTVTTNSNGDFALTDVPYGTSNVIITPSLTGHTFSPESRNVSGPLTGNVTGRNFSATLLTFTVSGRITRGGTALQGVTVAASGGHTQTVTTNSNGIYRLTNVVYGSTDIRITPSLTGHSFSPGDRTLPGPVVSNTDIEDFSASFLTYSISGTIVRGGNPVEGVTVRSSGGHSQTVTTDSDGLFRLTEVVFGSRNITITPELTGHNFDPSNRNVSGPVDSDINGRNFTARINTYRVSGTVSGDTQDEVNISIAGDHSASTQTGSNGNFSMNGIPFGSSITVTPEKFGFSFDPAERQLSDISSNQNDLNFNAIRWRLRIERQPTDTEAGKPISPSIIVQLVDATNSIISGFNGPISLHIHTNPSEGTLSGSTSVNAVNGIATFSGLTIDKSGEGYRLRATGGGFSSATSQPFNIFSGAAASLIFAQQPVTSTAGGHFEPAVAVHAIDSLGNLAMGYAGRIDLALASNPNDGSLNGSKSQIAANGTAIFEDLWIDKSSDDYTLRATAPGLNEAVSDHFSILPGEPAQLVFIKNPSLTVAGIPIEPPIEVQILDSLDNPVPEFEGVVTIELVPNGSDAALSGTTEQNSEQGIAEFGDISIVKSGKQYRLRAFAPELTEGISEPFEIIPAKLSEMLLVSGDDQIGAIHKRMENPFVVQLVDEYRNPIPEHAVAFDLISEPDQAGSSIDTIMAVTDEHGTASTYLTPGSKPGTYTVSAIVSGLSPVTFTADVPTYTISGRITEMLLGDDDEVEEDDEGMRGVVVRVSGGITDTVTTDDEGEFEIEEIPRGAENIVLTPSYEGYGFLPASITIEGPVVEDIEDLDFKATQFTYDITGRVVHNGTGVRGVSIIAIGGHIGNVTTDENGEYIFTNVAHGATGISIVPNLIGYGFLPPTRTYAGPISDHIRIGDFNAVILVFTISGTVTHDGAVLQGVSVTAEGGYEGSAITGSNGRFNLTGVPFGARDISIAPQKDGYSFEPDTVTISDPIAGDTGGIDFAVAPPPPPVPVFPENDADSVRTNLTLAWEPVPGATSYGLIISNDSMFVADSIMEVSGITGTEYQLRNLRTDATYYWRTRAENIGGMGPWSELQRFTTTSLVKFISITSPSEGEIWMEQGSYTIRWESQEVDQIDIEYSVDNGSSWLSIVSSLDAVSKNHLWILPSTPSTESRIRIMDAEDTTYSDLSPPFTIYPVTIPVHHTTSFGNADAISSYRMIGLPGNLNLPIQQVLSGDPLNDWTAFHDNGGNRDYLVEFDRSDRFAFKPGNGFWILSKNGFLIDQTAESVPLESDKTFNIPVHQGWNIISNPYDVPVRWNAVAAVNGITESLWEFDGSYRSSETLEPFRGYYFFNRTNTSGIRIPYPNGNSVGKNTGNQIHAAGTYTARLWGDGQTSRPIWIHRIDDEISGSTSYRKYAPPGDFEELGISIYNEHLGTEYKYLAEDIWSSDSEGEVFILQVSSAHPGAAHLELEGFDPSGNINAVLIERKTGKVFHEENGLFPYVLSGTMEREFALVVGTEEFIGEKIRELLPREYTLAQNYPNPFNPETTIEYSLAEGTVNISVHLEIYNILGQKVRTLVRDMHTAGFYSVTWDGTNDLGNSVASGMYLYTLRAGEFREVKRMILLR